jgi:hypothetical protein
MAQAEVTKITSGGLIAAKKVLETDVYNPRGEKLGTVEDIMIDKVSGKAAYAIMSFDGFLGIGEKYHPLPWSTLTYDESKGGYVVNLDKKMLENATSVAQRELLQVTKPAQPVWGRGSSRSAIALLDCHGAPNPCVMPRSQKRTKLCSNNRESSAARFVGKPIS